MSKELAISSLEGKSSSEIKKMVIYRKKSNILKKDILLLGLWYR